MSVIGVKRKGASSPPRRCIYATPQHVIDLNDCWFYHTLDLPGYGTVPGLWDLRDGVADYLGRTPLRGKRVLEIGTASGFLCFAMERQGAEVVAVDLPPGQANDFVPRARLGSFDPYVQRTLSGLERMRKSYWLGHRVLRSAARVFHGSVYALPAELGLVDVSTFGCILLHLRDPFLALANALRLTREKVIITMMLHCQDWQPDVLRPGWLQWLRWKAKQWVKLLLWHPPPDPHLHVRPCARMLPSMVFLPEYDPEGMDTWWFFTPLLLQQFISILGFEKSDVTYHTQVYRGRPQAMYTVVGQRTQPLPRRIDGPYPWC
jgi:hypothetical protein